MQIDNAYPNRSKRSDGAIGDAAHRKRKSDHNPNRAGVVQAIDLTHDPNSGFDSYRFAEHLRITKDARIKYVISNHRIFHRGSWVWQRYTQKNPHTAHVHVSVSDDPKLYDAQGLWQIRQPVQMGIAAVPEPMPEPTSDDDTGDRCWWENVADKGIEENEGDLKEPDA